MTHTYVGTLFTGPDDGVVVNAYEPTIRRPELAAPVVAVSTGPDPALEAVHFVERRWIFLPRYDTDWSEEIIRGLWAPEELVKQWRRRGRM